jgi:hypothetical protein
MHFGVCIAAFLAGPSAGIGVAPAPDPDEVLCASEAPGDRAADGAIWREAGSGRVRICRRADSFGETECQVTDPLAPPPTRHLPQRGGDPGTTVIAVALPSPTGAARPAARLACARLRPGFSRRLERPPRPAALASS